MCGFDQAVTDDQPEAAADPLEITGDAGSVDLNSVLGSIFGAILGGNPNDPETFKLTHSESGQRAFEFGTKLLDKDKDPTITFTVFQTNAGHSVATVRIDPELVTAQENIAAEADWQDEANTPDKGAVIFSAAQLRAVSELASETADALDAANAQYEDAATTDEFDPEAAISPSPELPPVLVGGPDA